MCERKHDVPTRRTVHLNFASSSKIAVQGSMLCHGLKTRGWTVRILNRFQNTVFPSGSPRLLPRVNTSSRTGRLYGDVWKETKKKIVLKYYHIISRWITIPGNDNRNNNTTFIRPYCCQVTRAPPRIICVSDV